LFLTETEKISLERDQRIPLICVEYLIPH